MGARLEKFQIFKLKKKEAEKQETSLKEISAEKQKKKEEKPKEEKSKGTQELEEAIRSLDSFKKLEQKGVEEKKPNLLETIFPKKEKSHEKGLEGSKNLKKCHKLLLDAKVTLGNNNIEKARDLYIEARNIYVALENKEKHAVYHELHELYAKLPK